MNKGIFERNANAIKLADPALDNLELTAQEKAARKHRNARGIELADPLLDNLD